jgi:phage/conjugal plasmid C-4 type zinc finger TraR family protein
MDEGDRGNISADRFQKEALARQLNRSAQGESLTECEDCGEPIPEGRRKAVPGCVRCVICETKFERKSW